MAANVSRIWCFAFSTTSSGRARPPASLMYALSLAITGLTLSAANTPLETLLPRQSTRRVLEGCAGSGFRRCSLAECWHFDDVPYFPPGILTCWRQHTKAIPLPHEPRACSHEFRPLVVDIASHWKPSPNGLIGMHRPPQSCKRNRIMAGGRANVFGLEWSRRLPAMMDIRSPSSYNVDGLVKTFFRYQVSRAWERPMAISVFRQQTGQELFP